VEVVVSDSLNTIVEWFFASPGRVTDTPTHEDDRSEVYNVAHYIARGEPAAFSLLVGPNVPTKGDVVVNIKRPKYIFTKRDLRHLLQATWTQDPAFVPERFRIQCAFIFPRILLD
jgi:hypothetical protein